MTSKDDRDRADAGQREQAEEIRDLDVSDEQQAHAIKGGSVSGGIKGTDSATGEHDGVSVNHSERILP